MLGKRMDRGESQVRGTDTTVHGTSRMVRATAPFQRYLESMRETVGVDPNDALTASLPTRVRRQAGAFFTSAALADTLVEPFKEELRAGARVVDPTCGAGDLLLAAARCFKVRRDPERRIEDWEKRIFGRDLFEEFVLSARLRMFRAAQPNVEVPDLQGLFPGIKRGNSLEDVDAYNNATHILLNPPYTLVRAPSDCEWRTGRVSAAALFTEIVLKSAEPTTRIGAVLPDVLRSGSGYAKWRAMLGRIIDIKRVQVVGRFARWADVDVFVLHGVVRSQLGQRDAKTSWPSPKPSDDTLDMHAAINVGSVVDYRSPRRGPWCAYLTVDNAAPWRTVSTEHLPHRRFAGRVIKPPFVVVRRTSRAGDSHRMVGTIVTGSRNVAVENHLIVIRPNVAAAANCEALLRRLKDSRTTEWLDERIRLRHLTVEAVSEMPWWSL